MDVLSPLPVALSGEQAQHFWQDVAPRLELLALASQTRKLFALGRTRQLRAASGFADVGGGPRDPALDALIALDQR